MIPSYDYTRYHPKTSKFSVQPGRPVPGTSPALSPCCPTGYWWPTPPPSPGPPKPPAWVILGQTWSKNGGEPMEFAGELEDSWELYMNLYGFEWIYMDLYRCMGYIGLWPARWHLKKWNDHPIYKLLLASLVLDIDHTASGTCRVIRSFPGIIPMSYVKSLSPWHHHFKHALLG